MWRQHADEAIARRLKKACARRDPEAVARTLRGDVEMVVDGGAGERSHHRSVRGAADVAAALVAMIHQEAEVVVASVNGSPGLTVRLGDRVVGVLTFRARRRTVERLWLVTDPARLGSFNRR